VKAVVDEARGGDQQEKLPVPKGFHFQRRLRARAQVPADPEIVESIKASCKNSIRDSVRSLGNNRCAHRLSPVRISMLNCPLRSTDVGRLVEYTPGNDSEPGRLAGWNHRLIFVRFETQRWSDYPNHTSYIVTGLFPQHLSFARPSVNRPGSV